jgi:cleavage and polyadenylation specificity factor subunit 3
LLRFTLVQTELLLILDEYWESCPELHDIPIYYGSALAQRCMKVYENYIYMMNDRIRQKFAISNPFQFKHIQNLTSIDHFIDDGPSVVMASPGILLIAFTIGFLGS